MPFLSPHAREQVAAREIDPRWIDEVLRSGERSQPYRRGWPTPRQRVEMDGLVVIVTKKNKREYVVTAWKIDQEWGLMRCAI